MSHWFSLQQAHNPKITLDSKVSMVLHIYFVLRLASPKSTPCYPMIRIFELQAVLTQKHCMILNGFEKYKVKDTPGILHWSLKYFIVLLCGQPFQETGLQVPVAGHFRQFHGRSPNELEHYKSGWEQQEHLWILHSTMACLSDWSFWFLL